MRALVELIHRLDLQRDLVVGVEVERELEDNFVGGLSDLRLIWHSRTGGRVWYRDHSHEVDVLQWLCHQ